MRQIRSSLRLRGTAAFVVTLTSALAAVVAATLVSPASAASAAKDPVVIVGGMSGSGQLTAPYYWPLSNRLTARGYDVHIFITPDYGLGGSVANAELLKGYVDEVKASTGTAKVDLVTHSQGGIIARYYLKYHDGAANVDSLIMMGTPNHGSALADLAEDHLSCLGGLAACVEHTSTGAFLTDLNGDDETIGDVSYTAITSEFDELVVPHTSVHLNPAHGNVTNVTTQDYCPRRFVDHASYPLDGAVFTGILTALQHDRFSMKCWAW